MSKYVRHFLEDVLGAAPSGVSAVLVSGTPSVSQVSTPAQQLKWLGDRLLSSVSQAAAFGSPSHRVRCGVFLTDPLSDANRATCQIRTAFGFANLVIPGLAPKLTVGARISGAAETYSGYFVDINDTTNTISLIKAVAGAETVLATVAFVWAYSSVDNVHVVFDISGTTNTTVQARVWTEAQSEPSGWTITAVDSSSPITAAGNMLVGSFTDSTAYAPSIWYISCGTGGDSAPARPKTWQEYLDFLDTQDALRCMLIEIDVLSDMGSPSTAVTGKVCVSNYDFKSAPEDYPYPNICYEEILQRGPQIRRRMSSTFTGRMTITAGDFYIKNDTNNADTPTLGETFSGRLDAWLSYNWDGRQARVLFGSPQWRRVDFKTYYVGTIEDIYRAGYAQLGFKWRGYENMFQKPVTTELIGGTGPNKDSIKPYGTGPYFNVSPKLYDSATLRYQLDDASSLVFSSYTNREVLDSGVSLNFPATYFSANIGTDVMNMTNTHNWAVGDEVVFDTVGFTFSLPSPLVPGETYYVARIPSASTVAFTATPGSPTGSTIVFTDSPAAGATAIARRYSYDSGTGLLTLHTSPAGTVTAKTPASDFAAGTLAQSVDAIFSKAGVTTYLPGFSRSNLLTTPSGPYIGCRYEDQKEVGDVVNDIARSANASFCISRFGTWYLVQLGVPTGTATWSIGVDDVRNWRNGQRFMPRSVERLGYQHNYTVMKGGDLAGAVTVANRDLYGRQYTLANYTPSESGLDQPANHLLREDPPERDTYIADATTAATEVQRNYGVWRRPSATHIFDTDCWALAMEIGEELQITYPRDGYSSGKYAILVGTEEDALINKMTLEVWAPIDSQWPRVTTSGEFISGAYY